MKTIFSVLLSTLLTFAAAGATNDYTEREAPEVPATLQAPAGYRLSWHAYAVGAQVYTATVSPTDATKLVWTFTGPEAVLFDADGIVTGIHYAYSGPTRPAWETISGSFVVGVRTIPPVVVNPNSIPWLILDAEYAEGPGVLKRTLCIQRVNTTGGLAPTTPPTRVGEQARIPYTAEYFFYRGPAVETVE
jgi:hypothetical protein